MSKRASLPPTNTTTTNYASPGATIGVQANEVHNSTIYQVFSDDPPEKKYRVGLQYLKDGVPFKAQELIGEAIAGGLKKSAEVRLNWALAMLSKRSYRDLSRAERGSLDVIAQELERYPEGEYKNALEAIWELLCHLKDTNGDAQTAEKNILALPAHLRTDIDRHLSELLSGATKDRLWAQRREQAGRAQHDHDRTDRVWAYFHPEPIRPRIRATLPPQVFPSDLLHAISITLLATLAAAYLAWLALQGATLTSMFVLTLAIAAGYVGFRDAFEWRYRIERIRAGDHRLFTYATGARRRGNGFAAKVSRSFKRYFLKYRLNGVDSEAWMIGTSSIRGYLRDEICEIYRESSVQVNELNWLIGYLAQEVRRRWRDGSIYDYRSKYHVDQVTKARCLLSLALALAAATPIVAVATQTSPFTASAAIAVLAASSPFAVRKWKYISRERRRARDDREEAEEQYIDRTKAYRRWKKRLDETRPSETEMETWLECDKTILTDAALRHYRLAWRDIIASAVFQGPARDRKRRRTAGGPWRYSSYDLLLFLITEDGVREVASTLNFKHATFNGQERNNFRFDAVSSVEVAEGAGGSLTLSLTLTNGPTKDLYVTESETIENVEGNGLDDLFKINLSAAGFIHALRILEGIAAEGKDWIERDGTSHTPLDSSSNA